jgi:hypothetical protein
MVIVLGVERLPLGGLFFQLFVFWLVQLPLYVALTFDSPFLLFFYAPIAFKADAVGDVAILGYKPLVVAAFA